MAFPTSPINGQTTTQNGLVYTYNSTLTAWVLTTSTTGAISATAVTATANITGGNLITTGTMSLTGNIVSTGANAVANIGSATLYFNTVFAKATSAQYADLAEMYRADADYAPGTLVIFGGPEEVTVTDSSHDTKVVGVVSENPSYTMNAGLSGEYVLPVALTGRVPCCVYGNISIGDLLVSGNITGTATRLDSAQYQPGCVIGKSLADYNSDTVGKIEIAVGIK